MPLVCACAVGVQARVPVFAQPGAVPGCRRPACVPGQPPVAAACGGPNRLPSTEDVPRPWAPSGPDRATPAVRSGVDRPDTGRAPVHRARRNHRLEALGGARAECCRPQAADQAALPGGRRAGRDARRAKSGAGDCRPGTTSPSPHASPLAHDRRPKTAVTSTEGRRGLDRAGGVERPSAQQRAARHAAPTGGSNRLLSVDELAAYLGVPKKTVYGCWRQWGLRGYRVGRYLRFRERQVEEWLQSREV